METLKNKQKGFGAIEVLLILVLFSVIIFIGLCIRRNNSTVNYKSTVTSVVEPGTNIVTEAYNIPDWKVKIPNKYVPVSLSYTLPKSYKDEGSTISFRSSALDSAGKIGCSTNSVIIARGAANQLVPNDFTESTFTYKKQYEENKLGISNGKLPKDYPTLKIGDYYFVIPQIDNPSCAEVNNKKQADAESKAVDAIWQAIDQMIAL
ncbi:MAG: prepilin-type N-terminal cleavage/methylation domain-containing protein [Candidatus Saccharimonadales bacterium]